LDEKIIALYAGGMTTREIETYIADLYGPGVGRDTVSRVTAAVLDDTKAWQTRPLEAVYPILYLDALVIKIRDGQAIKNFSCYLAIGVNTDGEREVLGMWFQRTEGAKFWLQVLTELKQRGVQDVLVCCVDGLTGFPDAIEAVYLQTWVQTCLVHQVRSSLRFVPYKDKKKVASDLRKIYTAVDRDHAEHELEAFAETWDQRYPMIVMCCGRVVLAAFWVAGCRRPRLWGRFCGLSLSGMCASSTEYSIGRWCARGGLERARARGG
jgi:putative transposase